MKALDILYRMKKANDEIGMGAQNIDEAIAELEALQQRSCESCKHLLHKLEYQSPFCLGHNYRLTHENKKVLSCNRYEAKGAMR